MGEEWKDGRVKTGRLEDGRADDWKVEERGIGVVE
jgi:hypothetical protein